MPRPTPRTGAHVTVTSYGHRIKVAGPGHHFLTRPRRPHPALGSHVYAPGASNLPGPSRPARRIHRRTGVARGEYPQLKTNFSKPLNEHVSRLSPVLSRVVPRMLSWNPSTGGHRRVADVHEDERSRGCFDYQSCDYKGAAPCRHRCRFCVPWTVSVKPPGSPIGRSSPEQS